MNNKHKKKLTVIMYTYDKGKLNYGLSIISAAAAINWSTEIFFAGDNIYNILDIYYLKKIGKKTHLDYSNSEELLNACKDLKTNFSVCSAALETKKIDPKFLRKDLKISISGIVSVISNTKNNRELIFI